MDAGLLAWGRAVKQRQRRKEPVLWLFTDARRGGDPLRAIAALPRDLCGVVFRHDGVPDRAKLALQVAKLCRKRRLRLVVAGDARLAARIGAGCHLRKGSWEGHFRPRGLLTSSAHDIAELRMARQAGAQIIFLSPVFSTASHPGGRPLGALRWANMAKSAGGGKSILSVGLVEKMSIFYHESARGWEQSLR